MIKFSSKIDEQVLDGLRAHAESQGQSIAFVLTEAVREYLDARRVRPAFRSAVEEVLSENDELLKRLAK